MADEAGLHEDLFALLDLNLLGQPGNARVSLDGLLHLRLERRDFLLRLTARRRLPTEIDRIHFLAGIDQQVFRPGDFQHAQRALVEGARERMVHDDEAARHVHLELDDGRAARRDEGRLHVLLGHERAALEIDAVEDFADDVEGGEQVRPAVADVEPHRFADLGGDGLIADERADGAVEQHVGRPLVRGLLLVERLQAFRAGLARRVEVALHHVVFALDGRQALLRLDEDEAIHPVGDVHRHRGGRAVIDVEAGIERLEGELRRMPRGGERRRRAAARAGDRVQVNVVRQLARRVIRERELDEVALADADEAAGHITAEGPEEILHAIGQLLHHLAHFELHDDLGGVGAVEGRRHLWGLGQHGDFLADDAGLGSWANWFSGVRCGEVGSRQCERQDRQHAESQRGRLHTANARDGSGKWLTVAWRSVSRICLVRTAKSGHSSARSTAFRPQQCAWDDRLPGALLCSSILRRERHAPRRSGASRATWSSG